MTDSGKKFPKKSHYLFDNGDMQAEFEITWKDILELRDSYDDAPANKQEAMERAKKANVTDMPKVVGGTKELYDRAHIHPVYMHFFANGRIKITKHGKSDESHGTMIYEDNYVGCEDERAHL